MKSLFLVFPFLLIAGGHHLISETLKGLRALYFQHLQGFNVTSNIIRLRNKSAGAFDGIPGNLCGKFPTV